MVTKQCFQKGGGVSTDLAHCGLAELLHRVQNLTSQTSPKRFIVQPMQQATSEAPIASEHKNTKHQICNI